MSELPLCPSCHAPVSARATQCVLCDAPLEPAAVATAVYDDLPSAKTDESVALRPELRPLYSELSQALAPTIRVTRLMAEGGMGLVFIGRDATLKRDVAIKVLSPKLADDTVARTRFTREAERAAAVSHPNIVGVYQVGELLKSRIPYFVMQYVEGPTLADATGRVLPDWRVRRLVVEVAAALAAAHGRELVHRDVKPENVVLDGETGRALVLDFGISAALSSRVRTRGVRLTTEGMYVGTPTYMSPEQVSGDEITPKSDIYSLGVVAYELLTGHPPFRGNTLQVMASHVKDRPPSLAEQRPDVSPELVTCIERCMEKDPARRPQAAEIVRHLQPESKQELEWPPPGLSPLRRAGARLVRMMAFSALATTAFFATLAVQPRAARPGAQGTQLLGGWADPVRSVGMAAANALADDGATHADTQDAALWSFLLVSFVALMVVFAASVALRMQAAVRIARRGRDAGYPWRVLLEVAADGWADTRDLLNGAGAFAYVDAGERRRLLSWRRAFVACLTIAFVVAAASAALWISGALAPLASATVVALTPLETLVVVAPAALAIVAAWACRLPELRVRRREGRAGRLHLGRRGALVNRDLVQSWLAGYGDPTRPADARWTGPRLALGAAIALLGAAAAAGALIVLAVVGESTMRLVPSRARAAEWIGARAMEGPRAMPWAVVDSVLGEVSAHSVGDADPGVPRAFVAAFTRAATREAPRLDLFRALAHAPAQPYFWSSDAPAAPFRGAASFSPALLGAAARANAEVGSAALARGDTADALERAREDLAVARQLARTIERGSVASAVLVGQAGEALMRAVAGAAHDAALAVAADSVGRALATLRDPVLDRPDHLLLALFADPRDSAGLRLVADRTLPPHARVRLLGAILDGYCLDSREVLFGPSTQRLTQYDAAVQALADVPGAAAEAARWRTTAPLRAGLLGRVRACVGSP